MSLLAWFPLNGNLDDQGLIDLMLQSVTTPSFVAGKVTAQAMSTGAATISASQTAKLFNPYEMSFCFWIKPSGTDGSGIIFGNDSMTHPNNRKFSIFQWNNKTRIHLSWQSDTSDSADIVGWTSDDNFLELDKWTHVTIVYNYKWDHVKIYKNGILTAKPSLNKPYPINTNFTNATSLFNNSTLRYLNDFRIYDHALSQAEVKKLAQGLTFHSTFNFEDFYIPVDYLESDGNQYIDTGIEVDADLETHLEYAFSSYDGNERYVFGLDSPTVIGMISGHGRIYEFGQERYSYTLNYDRHTAIVGKRIVFDGTIIEDSVTGWSTGKNAFLFCSNTGSGNPNYYSSSKLYSCKMYNSSGLVRDFIPCVRKYDHKPGLYDLVENEFYTNANTSSSTDFKAPCYEKVLLQCEDGQVYIDTGITTNQDYEIEIKSEPVLNSAAASQEWFCIIGTNYNNNNGDRLFYKRSQSRCVWQIYGNNWQNSQIVMSRDAIIKRTREYYVVEPDKTYAERILFDNIQDFAPTKHTCLFGSLRDNADGIEYPFYGVFDYCKIWHNGMLIKHFIGVKNLLTNELGVLDLVEKKFYPPNNGSFTQASYDDEIIAMCDCSGYNYNISAVNIDTSKETAWGNSCAVFNGTDSYIDTGINLTDNMTFICWVKFNASYAHIIDCRDNNNTGYQPMYGGPGYGLQFWSTNDTTVDTKNTWTNSVCGFTTDTWYHIAVTVTPTYSELFINGDSKGRVNANYGYNFGARQMKIGTRFASPYTWLNGDIADVRVYATTLSSEDIKELYENRIKINSTKTLFCGNIVERDGKIELTKENVLSAESFSENNIIKIEEIDSEIDSNIYDRLEYIQNSGTQYIDTNFIPNQDTSIEIKFSASSFLNNQLFVFGSGDNAGQNGKAFELYPWTNPNPLLEFNYDDQINWGSQIPIPFDIIDAYQKKNQYGYTTRAGQSYHNEHINSTFTAPRSLTLFAINRSIVLISKDMKLYSCKIWDNENLIHNFIAVKNKQIDKTGLFDTVTQEFYSNSGSGDFIAGPIVKKSFIVKQLIEE